MKVDWKVDASVVKTVVYLADDLVLKLVVRWVVGLVDCWVDMKDVNWVDPTVRNLV